MVIELVLHEPKNHMSVYPITAADFLQVQVKVQCLLSNT
jgi:hypothetical protein